MYLALMRALRRRDELRDPDGHGHRRDVRLLLDGLRHHPGHRRTGAARHGHVDVLLRDVSGRCVARSDRDRLHQRLLHGAGRHQRGCRSNTPRRRSNRSARPASTRRCTSSPLSSSCSHSCCLPRRGPCAKTSRRSATGPRRTPDQTTQCRRLSGDNRAADKADVNLVCIRDARDGRRLKSARSTRIDGVESLFIPARRGEAARSTGERASVASALHLRRPLTSTSPTDAR